MSKKVPDIPQAPGQVFTHLEGNPTLLQSTAIQLE